MIEPIMYLAIGFLVSMLLGLMVLPLVHNRAVRLTTRRLDAATPLSMTEIQADKDQLRADFAMSSRKLETSLEQFKNKAASQAIEIAKKADTINRMKAELDEKIATVFSLEARDKRTLERLKAAEAELERITTALGTSESSLAARRVEIAAMTDDVANVESLKENHAATVSQLTEEIEALTDRAESAENHLAATIEELATQRDKAETTAAGLADSRNRNDVLIGRVSELDRQVASHRDDAETLRRQVGELETMLTARTTILAQRESENANLRQAQEESRNTITKMRNEISAKAGRALTVERLRSEKAAAEQEAREAQTERALAQRELAAVRAQAENSWEVDRMENALLRERIDDIAAEVSRLALALEGAGGPIAGILIADQAKGETPGSLASRIRALEMLPTPTQPS